MPSYTVSRTQRINVSPELVFDLLRNFRRWPEWSPWLVCEPDARVDFSADGKSYAWEGRVVGAGSISVTGEQRPVRIEHELAFLRPFKSRSKTGFRLTPSGSGTEVTWRVEGSLPLFLFWLKPMLTAMLGMDFERGLRRLAAVLEQGKVPASLDFIGATETAGARYVRISAECAISDIAPSMQHAFGRISSWLQQSGTAPAGPWFSIYHKWDLTRGQARYSACVPISATPAALPDDISVAERPPLRTYAVRLTGSFEYLADAWAAGFGRAQAKVFKRVKNHAPFEIYEKSPETHPGETPVTVVHFPAA
ncbi:MAG TPA: SRPBCC family protein [Kiritimatiellia bacterium]|nr:SRPBCC family protein [Kiritimatiellia bacterium]